MTQLKHTILYLVTFCILFLVMSYFVSVNKELVFCSVNSAWISNDFLLSCFTGISASFMVLIASEVYKFFQMKEITHFYIITSCMLKSASCSPLCIQ